MRRQDFLDWADQYMRGELSKEDQIAFEEYCKEHPEITVLLEEHTSFLKLWKDTEERKALRLALAKEGKDIKSNSSRFSGQKILSLWSRLQINAAVAATVALVSVFSTLWLTGYFTDIKKATTDYSALRREMNSVKKNVNEQNKAIRDMNSSTPKVSTPIHFGATGFMLTKEGYVVTNNHVINGADSVHLHNSKGQSFSAKIIFSDPIKDLAILHIDDDSFKTPKNIPYTF